MIFHPLSLVERNEFLPKEFFHALFDRAKVKKIEILFMLPKFSCVNHNEKNPLESFQWKIADTISNFDRILNFSRYFRRLSACVLFLIKFNCFIACLPRNYKSSLMRFKLKPIDGGWQFKGCVGPRGFPDAVKSPVIEETVYKTEP
jgi:hypothetical protein